MGFVADTAIITQSDLEAITQEVGLEKTDGNSSAGPNATLANAMIQATNFIIRELKKRGIDPAKVTNTADFKAIAAWDACAVKFASQPQGDEDDAKKADYYRRRADSEVRTIFVEEDGAGIDQASQADLGLPRVGNFDALGNFCRGVDNTTPSVPSTTIWTTK